MARTTRKKGAKGQGISPLPDSKPDYNDGLTSHPPPPPELDPTGAAGYASYSSHGGEYGSHDLGSGGGSPGGRGTSPHASRAYFPGGAPGSAGDYSVDDHSHHVQHLPPLSEALHPDDAHHYPHSAGAYEQGHHTDASHASYDHSSSNFFDSQIMDPPPPVGDAVRHGSIHHAPNGNGAGNGHFNGSMMTPPPPSSHGQYGSSPYQGHGTAPHVFHRASISGPVMHSHYPPPPGTPTQNAAHNAASHAPPQAGEMAAWGTPSGSARPHTADGMFGSQMGGMPPQWAGSSMGGPDFNRGPRGSNASLASMSDAPPGSSGGKVFSYMPGNGDDSSSVGGSGSQSGGGPRKRPRRRYDEIERLYPCSWLGCQKSYGTLNHLNAHVAMQKHGAKRSPGEFKEMRKAWRKGKREDEQRRQANQAAANEEVLSRSKMMFPTPNQPFMTHGYPVNNSNFMPPPGPVPRYAVHPQASMYGSPSGYHMGVDASGRPYPGTHQAQTGQIGAQQVGQGSSGLGAYLMAHRGSI